MRSTARRVALAEALCMPEAEQSRRMRQNARERLDVRQPAGGRSSCFATPPVPGSHGALRSAARCTPIPHSQNSAILVPPLETGGARRSRFNTEPRRHAAGVVAAGRTLSPPCDFVPSRLRVEPSRSATSVTGESVTSESRPSTAPNSLRDRTRSRRDSETRTRTRSGAAGTSRCRRTGAARLRSRDCSIGPVR